MEHSNQTPWSRRDWLKTHGAVLGGIAASRAGVAGTRFTAENTAYRDARHERLSQTGDPTPWETLAQNAVDAAKRAGASYADARVTRTCIQRYELAHGPSEALMGEGEITGVGVRALVNGCWGFSASSHTGAETANRLARDAVAQANVNALAGARRTELAACPPIRGRWTAPVTIDPFALSIEEKSDYISSWLDIAERNGAPLSPQSCYLQLIRQERTVATSDGTLLSLTTFESCGVLVSERWESAGQVSVAAERIEPRARGWEHFLDANLPEQLRGFSDRLRAELELLKRRRPVTVGRYSLVCDGATMAALADNTLATSTQLDRALGYEANASGTGAFDNLLSMVGSAQVAGSLVTFTGNRSVPGQLATVPWDDEGVVPEPFVLIKNGVLTDFQTTREQATWLAPYYQKAGIPVRSHGCAASENALSITMQHTPNVALEPSTLDASLDDLVASVPTGILVTQGNVSADFQGRGGVLSGRMQRITNGRAGPLLSNGAIAFRSPDLWKHVTTLGGARSVMAIPSTQYSPFALIGAPGIGQDPKGEPAQCASHSASAPAALVTEQAIVDLTRRM